MSTAKLKVTVSCGSVKEQMYFRTSFFNNGIPLRNQFPIINSVLQKLVKPGYQVRVCRACVDHSPIGGWRTLEEVFAWLPTVRLYRTVYETVITKPACTEIKEHYFRMPNGVSIIDKWICEYGEYTGITFMRVGSKSKYLKPCITEIKDYVADKLGCRVNIGINNTLWISSYEMNVDSIKRFYGVDADLILINEVIKHPAECKTIKHIVEL